MVRGAAQRAGGIGLQTRPFGFQTDDAFFQFECLLNVCQVRFLLFILLAHRIELGFYFGQLFLARSEFEPQHLVIHQRLLLLLMFRLSLPGLLRLLQLLL